MKLTKNRVYLNTLSTIVIVWLFLSLVALAVSFFILQRSSAAVQQADIQRINSYHVADEIRQRSDDLRRMVRSYIITQDPEYLRQFNAVVSIRDGKIPRPQAYYRAYWDLVDINNPKEPRPSGKAMPFSQILEQAKFTKPELDKLAEAERMSTYLVKTEIQAINAVKGLYPNAQGYYARVDLPNLPLAQQLVFGEAYQRQKSAIMQPLDEFYQLMEARLNNEVAIAQNQFRWAQFAFLGLIALSMLLMVLWVILNKAQAKLHLKERAEAQQAIEDENEKLNNSVINILQSVYQLSQKDLTVHVPLSEDVVGSVADSINMLTNETSRVLNDVTRVARLVHNSSEKVRSQAQIVTETAEKERKSVNNMVAYLLETTQSMNHVAALAEESNTTAGQATYATNKALATVTDGVHGMELIRETIAETEKRIKRLGERSQEISGIVNVINTIAERTHVLALNASMQAAIAGEAGRGFAVVAEAIQRLAENSRNATQQIASQVSNIQIETNETINTVNHTISQIVEGSNQAIKAGDQMRQTKESTELLVSKVREIALASEQQKVIASQLLQAVQLIGESTKHTAEQIEAQSQETLNLQQAATRLVASVNVFKLPPPKDA